MTASESPLLEVRQVTKQFPGVRALNGVDLSLQPGEVLALIGENGAGKSTLMKILGGVQLPDSGEILVSGTPVRLDSVNASWTPGIALIHQELNLANNLQVGCQYLFGTRAQSMGWIDRKKIHRDATELLQRIGLNVPATEPLANLTIGRQQMVEIAKALSINAKVLIMMNQRPAFLGTRLSN